MKAIILLYIAFIVGVLIEGLKLSKDIKKFKALLFWCFILSLTLFIGSEDDLDHSADNRLTIWLWYFVGTLIFAIAFWYADKVRARLGEGDTLLATLSFLYFLAEMTRNTDALYLKAALIPSFFVALHAFSYGVLDGPNRFILSLWNTAIFAIFGIYASISLYGDISEHGGSYLSELSFEHMILLSSEHLMLGMAAVYILYNCYMLYGFIPRIEREYISEVKELTKEHLERYSSEQLKVSHAVIATFLHGGPMLANYYWNFISPRFLILFSISLSPMLINFLLFRVLSGPFEKSEHQNSDSATPGNA